MSSGNKRCSANKKVAEMRWAGFAPSLENVPMLHFNYRGMAHYMAHKCTFNIYTFPSTDSSVRHEWSLSALYQISCGETWSREVYVRLRPGTVFHPSSFSPCAHLSRCLEWKMRCWLFGCDNESSLLTRRDEPHFCSAVTDGPSHRSLCVSSRW